MVQAYMGRDDWKRLRGFSQRGCTFVANLDFEKRWRLEFKKS